MTMGQYDRKTLSPETARELAAIGLPPGKLFQLLRQTTVEKAAEMGIRVRIPFNEPFRVYLQNAKRPTGRRNGLNATSYETYGRILAELYAYCTNQKYDSKQWMDFPFAESEFDGNVLMNSLRPFLNTVVDARNLSDRTYNKYVAAIHAFIREIRDQYDLPKVPLPKFVHINQLMPLALSDKDVRLVVQANPSSETHCAARMLSSNSQTGN